VTRTRNFSNWSYWRLQHEAGVEADPCPLDNPEQLDAWRERVRYRLESMLGPAPEPVPLDLEVTETVDCGSYRRERVVFDTEATMAVPAYLLVPHDRVDAGPAVLAIHGHGPGKARICGVTEEEHDEGPAYAHVLASEGYVVLAPDLRGFGERADWMPDEKYHCDWDLVCATMAGIVPHARNLWDLQRSLDVLAEHPLVDPVRIAAGGLSYGATCTLFLAAIDERVRAAIVACYLSSWRAAHTVPWNMCGSQILPGQIGAIEHLDVASLIAPRPLLAENGTDDILFPVDAARATVESLRRVYAHVGARPDAIVHDVFDGGHRWHGTETITFLERWL
jgi:dienelactone hydrolase